MFEQALAEPIPSTAGIIERHEAALRAESDRRFAEKAAQLAVRFPGSIEPASKTIIVSFEDAQPQGPDTITMRTGPAPSHEPEAEDADEIKLRAAIDYLRDLHRSVISPDARERLEQCMRILAAP